MARESSRRQRKRRTERSDESDDERYSKRDKSSSRSPARKSRRQEKSRNLSGSPHRRKNERARDSSSPPARRSRRTRDSSSPPFRKRAKSRDSPQPSKNKKESIEESLSIEETNKLRAKLGLAPLDVNDKSKSADKNSGQEANEGEVFVEDGMQYVHKAAEHIGDKKRAEEMREKLQVMREKRKLHDKLSKVKGLADSDSDDDTSSWVTKTRELEEQRRRAEERAKLLDEMDAEFGIDALLRDEKEKKQKQFELQKLRRKQRSDLAGIVVGHAKEDFLEGNETILVLEDKDVLDAGDEILINPNMIENQRYARNAELRKKKDRYEPYAEDIDEFGLPKDKGLLSKYDEELNGEERKTFRLDEMGEVDIEKERQEMEIRRRLFMANKKLESLDSYQYKVASEFYSQEEMLSFRKPKRKKDTKKMRKRKEKILKADELIPDEETLEDNRTAKLILRQNRGEGEISITDIDKDSNSKDNDIKLEEGELPDDDEKKDKWRTAATSGVVDLERLNKLTVEESDSDEDLVGGVDLTGVLVDDDAEEELSAMLHRARKVRTLEVKKESGENDAAARVYEMLVKEEPMEANENPESGLVIDSTMEYCRNLGDTSPVGSLSGRKGHISANLVKQDESRSSDEANGDDEEDLKQRYSKEMEYVDESVKGKWMEATATTSSGVIAPFSSSRRYSSSHSDTGSYEPYSLLGEERDLSRGVGAMMKLAAEKGYLDTSHVQKVNGPSLKHLESKRFSQIEISRYDIEEKYTKKLERMGTTGTGPIRPFPEKVDYTPDIRINYVDERGREMEPKDAFRVLSWKFHGKGPGKKQIEKRQAKIDKKELMKKMNSMDTPLGTLNKQLKKQESMQTPYIILSGSGRDTGAPLKKE